MLLNLLQHNKQVVEQIERFIAKVPPEHRLGGLYLVDSIIKNAGSKLGSDNPYRIRFSQHVDTTIANCLQCSPKDKVSLSFVLISLCTSDLTVSLYNKSVLYNEDFVTSTEGFC